MNLAAFQRNSPTSPVDLSLMPLLSISFSQSKLSSLCSKLLAHLSQLTWYVQHHARSSLLKLEHTPLHPHSLRSRTTRFDLVFTYLLRFNVLLFGLHFIAVVCVA